MSALLADDLPLAGRRYRLRFPREGWAAPPLPDRPRVRYRVGALSVPVPPPLRRYVRGPVHFARLLGALTSRAGAEGDHPAFRGADLECAREVLRLFADERPRADGGPVGLHDRDAARLLLTLFPPVRCARCGRPYLRENERRSYCGDACRRAHSQGPSYGTGIPREAACAVCGGELGGRQRRYCGETCGRQAQNAAYRARWRARAGGADA